MSIKSAIISVLSIVLVMLLGRFFFSVPSNINNPSSTLPTPPPLISFPEPTTPPPSDLAPASSPSLSVVAPESKPTPSPASPVTTPELRPEPLSTQPTTPSPDVFSSLWPDYYRGYLSDTQDFLIDQKFISSTDKTDFQTENDIYAYLYRFLDFYRQSASLSDSDYLSLKSKLEAVPSLKDEQKQKLLGAVSLPGWLARIFNVAKAGYVTSGFYYKDDAPYNPSPGISSPVFCGNCGFEIITGTPHFRNNCGPYGALCDIHLGCLNGVCRSFPNAIWDSSTTMCGCG